VNLYTDLIEDPVGVFLQTEQVVLVEELVGRNGATEWLRRSDEGRKPARGCSRGPSSSAAPWSLIGSILGFQEGDTFPWSYESVADLWIRGRA
jgi:hypothetical protein|tara:strand:- start:52 stop:330 length:279 start_codon:yes stop_codon:yes gene_type:complete